MKDLGLPYQCSWYFDFQHPVETVWEYVANTDRMNRSIGLDPIHYHHEVSEDCSSTRFGKTKVVLFTLEWIEDPFEWERHKYFTNRRVYTFGPIKDFKVLYEFVPTEKGCRLNQTIAASPRHWLFMPLLYIVLGQKLRRDYLKAYKHLSQYLQNLEEIPYRPILKDRFPFQAKADQGFIQRFQGWTRDKELPHMFAKLIFESPEQDLVRIRPFAMARQWKKDKLEVLNVFLQATKQGIFDLSWDLLCPSCRGAKQRKQHLQDIHQKTHCDACNITYDVDFASSVELSFTVNPSIRTIEVGEFCIGGPQNTGHYLAQKNLLPGESLEFSLMFEDGTFIIRALQSLERTVLQIADPKPEEQPEPHLISFNKEREKGSQELQLGQGEHTFSFSHNFDFPLTLIIEEAAWLHDACTAAFVTSYQNFRDLFASEVLRPGQEIRIQAMAILFTDLKGSTELYGQVGDAAAFALVRDHFEILQACVERNQGAVVKTIGDAVMASFVLPENALQAGIEMHKALYKMTAPLEGPTLRLKVGIHYGPCFAVNLNERLDYFGSTVNLAARVEGQCKGDDVKFSTALYEHPSVQSWLAKQDYKVYNNQYQLKGFDEAYELYHIKVDEHFEI